MTNKQVGDLAQLIAKGVDLIIDNQNRARNGKILITPSEVRSDMLRYWTDILGNTLEDR